MKPLRVLRRTAVTGNVTKYNNINRQNMEALWTFPLYIIAPLIGLIVLIAGIVKMINGGSKTLVYWGAALLILPFFHLSIINIFQLKLENKIVGKYRLYNERGILTINEDKTFNMKNSITAISSGTGIWKIQEIDFPIIQLDFNSKIEQDLWLQIHNEDKPIILSTIPFEDISELKFVKEK